MARQKVERKARTAAEAVGDAAETAVDAVVDTAGDAVETVKRRAGSTARKVRSTAGKVADGVAGRAEKVADHASRRAAELRDAAEDHLDDARDALSETSDRIAARLRRAAATAQDEVAELPARVRAGVGHAVDSVRSSRVGDVADNLRGAVQRNPGLFVAGAAVAGFVLAQFMRGRGDDRS